MQGPPDDLDVVDYIQVTADTYSSLGYDSYRWADNSDAPPAFVAPTKSLDQCRVALIASGGIYRIGDVAFTHNDDTSFREIPRDVASGELRVTHFAYDQTNAREDINVVFPIDALRALDTAGEIGGLADVALTFMGGIYSQRRLNETLIPALLERVRELKVDIALLVPV